MILKTSQNQRGKIKKENHVEVLQSAETIDKAPILNLLAYSITLQTQYYEIFT